ncbi:MAG: PfkB family carbohydrate kinase [Bacilli bacterium]
MKYITIGHAAYDITLPIEEFPKENTKNRVSSLVECGGGPASNAAYLLGLWGCNTYFSGVLGNDYYGKKIKKEFDDIKVKTTYLELLDNYKTNSSYIMANINTGDRTILTYREKKLDNIERKIDEKFDAILVDGDEYFLSNYILNNNKDAISVIDAGRFDKSVVALGKLVKYFICSKEFAEKFSKEKIDIHNTRILKKVYDDLTIYFENKVIITLGSFGCFIKQEDYLLIPSIEVKSIDTTGAGDIFHGAFLYFITNGYPLLSSCYLSNVAGALSTTKIGGRNSMPTLEEVLKYADII